MLPRHAELTEDVEDHRGIRLAPTEVRGPHGAAQVTQDPRALEHARVVIAGQRVVRDQTQRVVARELRHDLARVRIRARRRLAPERAQQEAAHGRRAVGQHLLEIGLTALRGQLAVRLAHPLGAFDHERLRAPHALLGERFEQRAVADGSLVGRELGQEHATHVEQNGVDPIGAHQPSGFSTGRSCSAGLRTSNRETQIESS